MRTVTRLSQAAAVAALGLSLAACGSSSNSGSASTAATSPTSAATSAASSSAAPAPGTSSSTGGSDAATPTTRTPNATTLIHQARAAYAKAKSARMHADVTDSSDHEIVDIRGTMNGSNQDATVSTNDGSATIRTVGGKYYIKGDKSFWKSAANAPERSAALLADKWVKAPASMAAGLQDLTIKSFLEETIGPDSVSDAELAKATTSKTTYGGKPAYVVRSGDSKDTITIAADSKLILEVNGEQGSSTSKGKVTLTGWDQQSPLSAPPGAIDVPSSVTK